MKKFLMSMFTNFVICCCIFSSSISIGLIMCLTGMFIIRFL